MIHFHKYEEVGRYLMFTGEDRIIKQCTKCGKTKDEYSLETYLGLENARPYKEWLRSNNKFQKVVDN